MNRTTKELVSAGNELAKELHSEKSAALVKELVIQLEVQRVRADALAAENAYLLPKAASELSNARMLHKYWVGIQVALMHVRNDRLYDGMVRLQNTISGPGIEAPELSEFAEIEAWAADQQKDSIGHVRALEIIKAETPATGAALAAMRNEARAEVIPEGYVLVPQQIFLEPSDIESICSQCGDGGWLYGEFADGLLWTGDLRKDDGSIVHGLHISSADYPEEGGLTICEFAQQLCKGAAV